MGAVLKGLINVAIESSANPGEQALLASTPLITSVVGYTQPQDSNGDRLHLDVLGNVGTGTVTLNGTAVGGSVIAEVTPTIPVMPYGQAPQVVDFEYVSQNVFASLTSIAVSAGLTAAGGLMTLGAIRSGKYLLPCEMKPMDKRGMYDPNEHTGLVARTTKMLQLLYDVGWEIMQSLYPDESIWIAYLLFGPPVATVTIPATPDVLLAAVTVAATMTLTTGPKAPGEAIIFILTGTAVPGTIVLAGTNRLGQTQGETIVTNGAGTYYSTLVYQTLTSTQFTTTGMTAGSLAVSGVFAWKLTFNDAAGTFSTAAFEFFTGTESRTYPFSFCEEADLDFGTTKESKWTVKGRSQSSLPIGDRTTSPMFASRLAALSQPPGFPVVGWQSLAWIDALGNALKTTPYNNLLDCKLSCKVPKETITPATNTQLFQQVYLKKEGREFGFEATVDFRDLLQYEQFRRNLEQVLTLGQYGPAIGFISPTLYQKSWEWTLPFKFDGELPVESDPTKANVTAKFKGKCINEPSLGYSIQLAVVTQSPPVYTA